jgi:hypothetical protein
MEGKPSERELWEVTRMSRPALEAVIEQSLMLEPWKVVVAYCEHQRRGGTVPPRIANSFMVLVKDKGYEDAADFVTDTIKGIGYKSYPDLLSGINQSNPQGMEYGKSKKVGTPESEARLQNKPPTGASGIVSANVDWYNQGWLVALLCIVFAPLGFYALWKNGSMSRQWKIGLAFVGIVVMAGVVSTRENQEPSDLAGITYNSGFVYLEFKDEGQLYIYQKASPETALRGCVADGRWERAGSEIKLWVTENHCGTDSYSNIDGAYQIDGLFLVGSANTYEQHLVNQYKKRPD